MSPVTTDTIFTRALLTSLSAIVPALAILIVGLEPLRGFALVTVGGNPVVSVRGWCLHDRSAIPAAAVAVTRSQCAVVEGAVESRNRKPTRRGWLRVEGVAVQYREQGHGLLGTSLGGRRNSA